MRRLTSVLMIVTCLLAGVALAADELIPRPSRPARSYRIGVLEPNMQPVATDLQNHAVQAWGGGERAPERGSCDGRTYPRR